ncbi:MAG: PLP-dependent lyase/thiolase [Actinobacteria bacterium]|nr:PLP-dependent lyase/thiolase [Actinomycetota bacterium]
MIDGFRCASCGAFVGLDTFAPWRCPNENGDRRHVLLRMEAADIGGSRVVADGDDPNPFVRFRRHMAWYSFAVAHGMSDADTVQLVRDTNNGFRTTPVARSSSLSDELGFVATGGVWVKDETANVGGSQKARHLMSILLHLRVAETLGLAPWDRSARPSLAISSCGNAAIAAATLARAAAWPIEVFIPEWASGTVVDMLDGLGANINRCPRRSDDPPGDPTVLRFREAVARGAIPFSVQGPENALCLDGGRTFGWELGESLTNVGIDDVRALFVQVGGGAFAASASRGVRETGVRAPLFAVQTEGCAPLARAWASACTDDAMARRWSDHMWAWESEPRSLADGILDDETYDWVADAIELKATTGRVIVARETNVIRAADIGPTVSGIPVSPTGTAGLAGLLECRSEIADDDRVVLAFSGVKRD